jgi:dTDP-4-dehydrorhamnose reductase
MKYAVIGAAGQLGRDLLPRLPGEAVPLGRPDADLTRPAELAALLRRIRPDVVINCAAYNFVDKAETEHEAAFAVNAWGVRDLARTCAELGCPLLHFSTDFVFGLDERRHHPYAVDDAPGPVSTYGFSKLCGEYAVRAECPRHYVVRTCGLYGVWGSGGKGGNFVETMLRAAGRGQPLKVVNDQVCTPSYTADVAAAAVDLLHSGRYGLYHVTSAGATSWYDFATAIFELAGVKADVSPTSSRDFAAPARRPAYSVLDCGGSPPLRPWREALAAYLAERSRASSQRRSES